MIIIQHELAIHQRFAIDKATGYLLPDITLAGRGMVTKDGVLAEQVFNGERKLQMIKELIKCWPNITEACDRVGISRATYRNHYNADELFKSQVDEIAERRIDRIENVSVDLAEHNKMAIIDRMATLRANRPEKYDRAKTVKIQQEIPDVEGGRKRIKNLKNVIDVEIVKESMESQVNKDQEI